VEYSDIEGLEPEYYKSLKQILEYSLEDLGLELTFSAETQTFGKISGEVSTDLLRRVEPTPPHSFPLFPSLSHLSLSSPLSQVVDLIPNGRNMSVTDQNKIDYIRLNFSVTSMTSAIRSQIINSLDGFYFVVPSSNLFSFFSPTELELLNISVYSRLILKIFVSDREYHQYRAIK